MSNANIINGEHGLKEIKLEDAKTPYEKLIASYIHVLDEATDNWIADANTPANPDSYNAIHYGILAFTGQMLDFCYVALAGHSKEKFLAETRLIFDKHLDRIIKTNAN